MSALFLTLALLAAPPDDISGPLTMAPPRAPLRGVAGYRAELDDLSARELQSRSPAERAEIAVALTQLYRELTRDPRLVASSSLRSLQQRLRARLLRIRGDVLANMKRHGVHHETLTDEEVLAMADAQHVTDALADHFLIAGSTLGGPATVLHPSRSGTPAAAFAARGGGTVFDYGPALVDLIQQTLVPEFWDVHGGPGTIVYYRPLLCLVVRATSEVHHRIGGALDALGAAR